ncbi:tigger transposable element-derived protein 6-like [Argopecten irradians]|uniref:tigger transposable element-derived protein 6-like n=1 Tax=Argopecten irradians TaxID=31199 RepID=UPI003712220D
MSKPPTKRRRLELSLDDKIITESQTLPKPTHKQLSEKYGIGKSTVSDILKRKDVYMKNIEENSNGNMFRFSATTKYEQLNELMWDWFRQARDKSIPLSGPILQQKSLEFASWLQISDFKASNGWLDKFKTRHSIKAFKVSGESAGIDDKLVEDYTQQLPEICDGYSTSDIFNCDETGLYFRVLPDKTLSQKGSSSKGVKNSKERLTVMFACSATGEKLKPLVIGKAKQPRCFRNLKSSKMPVTWSHNRKAWMDSYIFGEWIKDVDRQMKREKRNILMFLDNATSHAKDIKLDNVKLKFLPANCTSHLQPLDQGIIRAFKARYRSKMMKSLTVLTMLKNYVNRLVCLMLSFGYAML